MYIQSTILSQLWKRNKIHVPLEKYLFANDFLWNIYFFQKAVIFCASSRSHCFPFYFIKVNKSKKFFLFLNISLKTRVEINNSPQSIKILFQKATVFGLTSCSPSLFIWLFCFYYCFVLTAFCILLILPV